MLKVLMKIWVFAGNEQKNIRFSIILSFFFAVFHMLQIYAIYIIILALMQDIPTQNVAGITFGLLLISILGRAVINRFSQLQQTHAGYFMVADKRIDIGDRLKKAPMGFFNQKSLGEVTGVTTTVLGDIENTGPMVLVNILSGFINSFVIFIFVLIFDWRIGLLVGCGIFVYLWITSSMEKKSAELTPKRQASESRLVSVILEYLQGMSIIKSFGIQHKTNVQEALEDNKTSNLHIEKLYTPYTVAQEMTLHLFRLLIMVIALLLYFHNLMSLTNTLMSIILSFLVFSQIQSAGSSTAALRLVDSSIDRVEELTLMPCMDDQGQNIQPDNYEIHYENVSFAYDSRPIIQNVTFTIPEKTTTAIVGPSGSGKSTLCHLLGRYWDIQKGRITIGGHDIKNYTLESLMNQMTMVFQNVYLFADTIENNIRFGKPQATHEEVVKAAKQACCDEFIMSLPQGYQTIIGEGGTTLSGGEKQRISIARAILKNAPIIILDEATANIDPENEDKLIQAIEALTHNKTIIQIAHRMKTVQNADQIIVLDQGKIIQHGTHDTLAKIPGLYQKFIQQKEQSENWHI